jgi:DNA-binding SARP family transcriptional activator/TolB-like protein
MSSMGTLVNDDVEDARLLDSSQLSVRVLGAFSAATEHRRIAITSRKARALIGYLLLSDVAEETRERVVGLLWSETPEDKARASLRQAVHELREAFAGAGGYFHADRTHIYLDRTTCRTDLARIVEDAERGIVDDRLLETTRIADTLLEGFEDLDSAFRVWLLARRQTTADRLIRALEAHLRAERTPRDARERAAVALLRLDGTHEEACRHLMREHADRGDLASALRIYAKLWDLLDTEYDLEPSQPTLDLAVAIKGGVDKGGGGKGGVEERMPARSVAAPMAAAPPIAILPAARPAIAREYPRAVPDIAPSRAKVVIRLEPFDMSAIEPAKAYLVQGFRHELIACLVRFREWLVKDKAAPAEDPVGRSGASFEYAVDGSAFQSADAIRLVLTLRTGDRDHIWSDRVTVSLDGWFDAQQSIVRRIAVALNVHLSAERLAKLAPQPDAALQVYDRWLRGQALIKRVTPLAWQRASDLFREIIREVPGFAPAYSSLVQLNNSMHLAHPGVFREREREQQTLTLARAAAALDPIDSRVQLCLGWSEAMSGQYGQAEINLGLAVDLNENDPWTLISSGHCFAFCGNVRRADELARQSLSLSVAPTRIHWGFLVGTRFLCGDYEGCVAAAVLADDVIPNLPAWKAAALHHLGRTAEAIAEARRFVALMQANWFGAAPPTDAAIARWFLHLFPINRFADWERLRQGIAGAGLPVDEIESVYGERADPPARSTAR